MLCIIFYICTSAEYKPECPRNCMGRGECVNGSCICDTKYNTQSPDCSWSYLYELNPPDRSYTKCPTNTPFLCENGNCVLSRAQCNKIINPSMDGIIPQHMSIDIDKQVWCGSNKKDVHMAFEGGEWMADNPGSNFNQRSYLNEILNSCYNGECESEDLNKDELSKLTDMNLSNEMPITTKPIIINHLFSDIRGLYASWKVQSSSALILEGFNGKEWVNIIREDNYKNTNLWLAEPFTVHISKIRVSCSNPVQWKELIILNGPLYDFIGVDMLNITEIGTIYIEQANQSYNGKDSFLQFSTDNITWTTYSSLNIKNGLELQIVPPAKARYIKFVHTQDNLSVWFNARFKNIKIYGKHGSAGDPPVPIPSKRSIKQVLGINGIWNWVGAPGKADLYAPLASSARNYHNLGWDFGTNPINFDRDYNDMPQSLGSTWLNWDDEYNQWNNASIEPHISFQFLPDQTPYSVWGSNDAEVEKNTKGIGYKFARHFGPTYGTGNVKYFEVGNEPWGYNAQTEYKYILKGFVKGLKEGDPGMIVMPCAFNSTQAMNDAIDEDTLKYLDAINIHAYSVKNNGLYSRIASTPEDPTGSFADVKTAKRWIEKNAPNLELHLTEFGWGALDDYNGRKCLRADCVSERQQAAFTERAVMLSIRWGVDRMHYFFYVDDTICGDSGQTNNPYACHGIFGAENTGNYKKIIYDSLKEFIEKFGNIKFEKVIREDDDLFVYKFIDGESEYAAVWRPVYDLDDEKEFTLDGFKSVSDPFEFSRERNSTKPKIFKLEKDKLTLKVGGYPILFRCEFDSSSTDGNQGNSLTPGGTAAIVIVVILVCVAIIGVCIWKRDSILICLKNSEKEKSELDEGIDLVA